MRIRIGQEYLDPEKLIKLLVQYQLLDPLAQKIILDQALSSHGESMCSPEETQKAVQDFAKNLGLQSESQLQAWLQEHYFQMEDLAAIATKALRIDKFKQHKWGGNIEAYFMERKESLDRVIYSLLRTSDLGIAQELYFRILDDPTQFAPLSHQYSQGTEAETGGLIGPIELSVPHPQIASLLKKSQVGVLNPPIRIENWYVILRLEKFLPAQLDDAMRQRLMNEQLEAWLQTELQTQLVFES